MLTQATAASYLLGRELVSARSIVECDVVVSDFTRRHSNFKVASEQGPCYLLKQGLDAERSDMLAREAAVYGLLHAHPGGKRFRRYIPELYLYRPEESTLVLELLRDSENLDDYHLRLGRFPTSMAALLGDALGTLHQVGRVAIEGDADAGFSAQPEWVLSIHRPNLRVLGILSNANLKLVKIVQQFPELCDHLDRLRHEWRAETLIHGDLKWSNCIAYAPGRGRRKGLKLVDWELAGMGDPCWDVGSVFNDYLSFWLLSIPITGEDPPEKFLELARYPLRKMQPAIRAFWRAYVRRMGLDAATAGEWLLLATRYGAARLVHTAYEHGQMAQQITGNAVCFLQLSLNMLQRPQEAALHLLGIAPVGPVRVQ